MWNLARTRVVVFEYSRFSVRLDIYILRAPIEWGGRWSVALVLQVQFANEDSFSFSYLTCFHNGNVIHATRCRGARLGDAVR